MPSIPSAAEHLALEVGERVDRRRRNSPGAVDVERRVLVLDPVALRRVEEGDALGDEPAGPGRPRRGDQVAGRPRCGPGWSPRGSSCLGLNPLGQGGQRVDDDLGLGGRDRRLERRRRRRRRRRPPSRPPRAISLGPLLAAASSRSPRARPRPAAGPAAGRSPRSLPPRRPSCSALRALAVQPFRDPRQPGRGEGAEGDQQRCRSSPAPRSSPRRCRRRG